MDTAIERSDVPNSARLIGSAKTTSTIASGEITTTPSAYHELELPACVRAAAVEVQPGRGHVRSEDQGDDRRAEQRVQHIEPAELRGRQQPCEDRQCEERGGLASQTAKAKQDRGSSQAGVAAHRRLHADRSVRLPARWCRRQRSLSTLRIIGLASPLGTARTYRCCPDRCDVQRGRGRAFNEADMSWPTGSDECASR